MKEESEKPGLKLNIQKTNIVVSGPITSWQIDGEKVETVTDFIFLCSKITAVTGDCSHKIKRRLLLGRKSMSNLDSILKKLRHYFADKGPYNQGYGFSSSHVWMWELDNKEDWVLKNWCIQIVVLEKTFKSPLESKEIKPINPKGNKPWIFIWRSDIEAETPVLHSATWYEMSILWKSPWCWERLRATGEGSDRGWDGSMESLP